MLYKSTRDDSMRVTASQAIIDGIAKDGGLYVPVSFPKLDYTALIDYSYQDMSVHILKMFLSDYTDQEIKCSVYKAYDEKFNTDDVVKIHPLENGQVLELYHGKTLAFKDMALSILPYLMTKAAKRLGIKEELVVLTATSGDTGKAALEGFADVPNTKIVVFYPSEGISDIQRQQMTTQVGKNTYVFGIKGNFDDAQSAVKEIFTDQDLKQTLGEKGYRFSSANSINIGRLIPQIVYYVYGYLDQVKKKHIQMGESINVVVPTGNFGNILAARYAKEIGLPIKTLICASNENKVLTDFINHGTYDLNRTFKVTNSPSMDILISSNLERYLSLIGVDVNEKMKQLKKDKKYTLDENSKKQLTDFYGDYATEVETLKKIKTVFENENYVMDTHTAVAAHVYDLYCKKTEDKTMTLIMSTASPYKFTKDVIKSIALDKLQDDEFELIDVLSETANLEVPESIIGLADKDILHPHIISKISIKNTIETILR